VNKLKSFSLAASVMKLQCFRCSHTH